MVPRRTIIILRSNPVTEDRRKRSLVIHDLFVKNCAFHRINIKSAPTRYPNICIAFDSQFFYPSIGIPFGGQCPRFIIQEDTKFPRMGRKRAWLLLRPMARNDKLTDWRTEVKEVPDWLELLRWLSMHQPAKKEESSRDVVYLLPLNQSPATIHSIHVGDDLPIINLCRRQCLWHYGQLIIIRCGCVYVPRRRGAAVRHAITWITRWAEINTDDDYC